MILVDPRVGNVELREGRNELLNYIQRTGVHALSQELEFGDACFEGNGPDGKIAIGVERKKIGDMLNCIDDARYAGHQRPGMLAMYNKSVLILEGVWKPEPVTGYLMECVAQLTWRPYKYRSQIARYSKLFRYLVSIQLSGIVVITTRDVEQTAYNIVELFHYFSKKWDSHTSMQEIQRLNIPEMRGKPSLVRRWASDLDGIGVKHSLEAEKVFKTPYELAKSDESDWMRIPGVGVNMAQSIIRQIHNRDNG